MGKAARALAAIRSPQFIKFAMVGASGVVVNLGFLALFADILDFQTNLASAFAIELSVLSNFALNDRWTFREVAGREPLLARALRFHLVSLVGASVQWVVFVSGNFAAFLLTSPDASRWLASSEPGILARYVIHPIRNPPETGWFKYFAQLSGIAIAMGWNFLANFFWTWSGKPRTEPS